MKASATYMVRVIIGFYTVALLAAILNNKVNIKFLHNSKGTLNLINGGFKYVYHLAF